MTLFESLANSATPSQYSEKLEELKLWLSSNAATELDVNDPVLISVLLGPMAKYLVDQQMTIDSLDRFSRLSSNVINSIDDPSLRSQLQQALAASLDIEQTLAGYAVGELRVTVSSPSTVTIAQGTQFSANGVIFRAPTAYFLRRPDQLVGGAGERTLQESQNQTWSATIPVVAVTPGLIGNLSAGVSMTHDLGGDVNVVTDVQFVGGRDANTIEDLIQSVFVNTAARTLGTRDQVVSFISSHSNIGNVRQVGVIGFGDPEMLRDKHSFLPMQSGGKADVYLASTYFPTTHVVELQAQYVRQADGKALFTFGVGRDVSPGYFRIESVVNTVTGERLQVYSETRQFDTSPIFGEQVPFIDDPTHAGFSRFQTATVQVAAAQYSGNITTDDSIPILVTFSRMVGLDIAQQEVASRNNRYLGGDILVRAAFPIYLTIQVNLVSAFDTSLPTESDLKAAIVAEVMRRPMRPVLYRSDIVQAIGKYLPDDLAVGTIEFSGMLYLPDGSSRQILSTDDFVIPDEPVSQLTPRTTAIYTAQSQVYIAIQKNLAPVTP